jgi:hypothetical protein
MLISYFSFPYTHTHTHTHVHTYTRTQTLALTNDLNEREDQIISLKKREAALEDNLKMKEKLYSQDAQVRLQLGKRLEQVLMDKEEIKDELDDLKVGMDRQFFCSFFVVFL